MRVAIVGEGETEYFCAPKLLGRLGHTIVHQAEIGGCAVNWELTIRAKVLPQVQVAALKKPDKILVFLDRENRDQCCGELANKALDMLNDGLREQNLTTDVGLIISDKQFESIVMADYELVDTLPILARAVSQDFGDRLDGKNPKAILDRALKPGCCYHKIREGRHLASKMRMRDQMVQERSRALRKLIKEAPEPFYELL